MRLTRYSLLALLTGFLLASSLLLVEIRQLVSYKGAPPDIEKLISSHPAGWVELEGSSVNPGWKEALKGEYDVAAARIYRNAQGEVVMVVMTWSRDGIRRAGHLQQICYQVSGCSVSVPEYTVVDSKAGRQGVVAFTAYHDSNVAEDVVYWRITGGKPDMRTGYSTLMATRFDKLNRLLTYMFSGMPDNIMVRVSTMRTNTEQPATAHLAYLKDYLEQLSPADRRLITGL